jgi:hypothetical protein
MQRYALHTHTEEVPEADLRNVVRNELVVLKVRVG